MLDGLEKWRCLEGSSKNGGSVVFSREEDWLDKEDKPWIG